MDMVIAYRLYPFLARYKYRFIKYANKLEQVAITRILLRCDSICIIHSSLRQTQKITSSIMQGIRSTFSTQCSRPNPPPPNKTKTVTILAKPNANEYGNVCHTDIYTLFNRTPAPKSVCDIVIWPHTARVEQALCIINVYDGAINTLYICIFDQKSVGTQTAVRERERTNATVKQLDRSFCVCGHPQNHPLVFPTLKWRVCVLGTERKGEVGGQTTAADDNDVFPCLLLSRCLCQAIVRALLCVV